MQEFDMNAFIVETLKPIGVPVYFGARKEVEPPLIIFKVNSEKGSDFWDNEEQVTSYRITINIFSRGNYIPLKNEVIKRMRQAGFIRTEVPEVVYIEDIGLFNQPIFFKFYKEL